MNKTPEETNLVNYMSDLKNKSENYQIMFKGM